MHPFANRSRALAMSTFGVSTGTPTASTPSTSRADDRQDQIEVVNHQVEDDVDVEAAVRETSPSRCTSMNRGVAQQRHAPPRPPD